jgi:hypothetical protein
MQLVLNEELNTHTISNARYQTHDMLNWFVLLKVTRFTTLDYPRDVLHYSFLDEH